MTDYRPPIPVQTISPGYAYVERRTRPGVITAIGVISIIVAVLTLMASFFTGVWATAMYAMAQASAMVAAMPPPQAQVNRQIEGEEDPIAGLPKSDRQTVIRALAERRPMTSARRKQLDALLAQGGRTMFPAAQGPGAAQIVRKSVTESGVLPSPRANATGPHYFVIGTGRIEVYDDHALFRPTGSGDVVSVNVDEAAAGALPPPPMPTRFRRGSTLNVKLSGASVAMLAAEALASAALAIYLFICGILVLRDSLRGGTLHWVYVVLKIPLALFGAFAAWRFWSEISAGASAPATSTATAVLIMMGLALIYPFMLALVLMGRGVREYYRS